MVPRVIVEGSEVTFDYAVRQVHAAGWMLETGFSGPYRPGAVARTGIIDTSAAAEAALLAALAGQAVVARATAPREVIDRFVDDLRRLGPVDHRVGKPEAPPEIDADSKAILGLLAEGHSLGEAAAILGLSRRTADRRLADGRRALGVKRTTAAILQARRLGWLAEDIRSRR